MKKLKFKQTLLNRSGDADLIIFIFQVSIVVAVVAIFGFSAVTTNQIMTGDSSATDAFILSEGLINTPECFAYENIIEGERVVHRGIVDLAKFNENKNSCINKGSDMWRAKLITPDEEGVVQTDCELLNDGEVVPLSYRGGEDQLQVMNILAEGLIISVGFTEVDIAAEYRQKFDIKSKDSPLIVYDNGEFKNGRMELITTRREIDIDISKTGTNSWTATTLSFPSCNDQMVYRFVLVDKITGEEDTQYSLDNNIQFVSAGSSLGSRSRQVAPDLSGRTSIPFSLSSPSGVDLSQHLLQVEIYPSGLQNYKQIRRLELS